MKSFNELVKTATSNSSSKRINLAEIISQQLDLPIFNVKKGIKDGLLMFNNKTFTQIEVIILRKVEIKYEGKTIKLKNKREERFDSFISELLKEFNIVAVDNIPADIKIYFCSYFIEYYNLNSITIDFVNTSKNHILIWEIIESFYMEKFSENNDSRIPKRKELITRLLTEKSNFYKELNRITTSLEHNLYDLGKSQIFQDYSKCLNSKIFKNVIIPIIGRELDLSKLFHTIIKAYKAVVDCEKIEEKIIKKLEAFKQFDYYQNSILLNNDPRIKEIFSRLIIHLTNKCNDEVNYSDSGIPHITIEPDTRTYSFDHTTITIHGFIENSGTGIAKNIYIQDPSLPKQLICEFLPPMNKVKISFSYILDVQADVAELAFDIIWENELNEKSNVPVKNFVIHKQESNLPWLDLKRSHPYSTQIVDDPNRLFGRETLIEDLRWNIEESSNIVSYVIYGQKRVGKSSIIRTLDTIYRDSPDVIFIYKTVGDVKNIQASHTLQKISSVFYTKLVQEFRKRHPKMNLESILSLNTLDNSLSGLIDIIDEINIYSKVKIIFAIDEFDELNKEFFENSELGKTFALNIGKGMNERANVGFLLVGSEAMEQKTKQGMRLNAFELKKVDTFDRSREFGSYCKIITEPSKSCLKFSDESLEYLFSYTNGNPYFTNILLDKVFREAFEKRISFLDLEFIKKIVDHQVDNTLSQKDFQHFWDDGLSEEAVNYEKILDRRRRVLTAFTETKKEKGTCTWPELKRKLKYPKKYQISENQMEDTLNEFKQRNIIKDSGSGELIIVPKLFEDWLLGSGLYQVIAQLEDKDEILDLVQQESKLYITEDELTEINTFLQITSKSSNQLLRNFLDQFEDNKSKRLITDLLLKTLVISASDAISFIKKIKKHIWILPIELSIDEKNIRKDTEIFTLSDSYDQNKYYLEIIKTDYKISPNKLIKKTGATTTFEESIKNVIFFEPVIDCPYYYRNEISKFLKKINPKSVTQIKIHLICFVISDDAKSEIEKLFIDYFPYEYDIHYIKNVQRSDISPYFNNSETIHDPTWKIISSYYPKTTNLCCLVKIGQLIPYQVFPIFWSQNVTGFVPLFSPTSVTDVSIQEKRFAISKKLKSIKFLNENSNLELKASLTEPAINWKEIQKLCMALKNMPIDKHSQIKSLQENIEDLWNLKLADKPTVIKGVKHSIAKTIAAFANTEGGELYVGIEDDFSVIGLSHDLKVHKSPEGILRALDNILNEYLGKEFANIINNDFVEIQDNTLIQKITVKKSNNDIWVNIDKKGSKLSNSDAQFFIRSQQETQMLGSKDLLIWKNSQ